MHLLESPEQAPFGKTIFMVLPIRFICLSSCLFRDGFSSLLESAYTPPLLANGRQLSYNQIVKDKALRLLLPGVVFSLVSIAIKIAFPGEMIRQTSFSIEEITHGFLYPYDNAFRELWFIVTLFELFLLTPLWKVSLYNKWTMWLMIGILIALHFWHPNTELLCINRVFNYAIWFYLGFIASKNKLVQRVLIKNNWTTLLIGIVVYIVGLYIHPFITTIGGITLSLGLALLFDHYLPHLFFTFRNYTYQIFLIGIFAQIIIKIVYNHIHSPYIITFLLCIIAGLYVPVLISTIVERLKWKPILLCLGLKQKTNNS